MDVKVQERREAEVRGFQNLGDSKWGRSDIFISLSTERLESVSTDHLLWA